MKKYFKVCFIALFVFAVAFVSGCNCKYAFYWEKQKTTAQDFILEQQQDGTYAIINLTPLARHKNQLTVPDVIEYKDEYLQISKVNLSFSDYTYLKKVVIKNANFNPASLNACKNLYCIEADFSLTDNPREYFKDIKDIKIYLTGECENPEVYQDFLQNENVFQGNAPKVSEIKSNKEIASNQTLALIVYAIFILLLIIGFLVNAKNLLADPEIKPLFITLFAVTVAYAIFLALNQVFNNAFYSYLIIGLLLVLPIICLSLYVNCVFLNADALASIPMYGSIVALLLNLIMGGAQGFWLIFIIALLLCGLIILIMEENLVDGPILAILTLGLIVLLLFMPTLLSWLITFVFLTKTAFWITVAVVVIGGAVCYFAFGLDGAISISSSSDSAGYESASAPKNISMDSDGFFSILFGTTDYDLPTGYYWVSKPTIKQNGNKIIIVGEIDLGEFDSYWSVDNAKKRCNEIIIKTAEKKINEHCKTYGISDTYHLRTEITYKYEL